MHPVTAFAGIDYIKISADIDEGVFVMPKEYDSVISEELSDISKGLRKRHRTGVSGMESTEMMQLRNRTDELAEAFGSGNETNREKKLKDAYKASLNYEMMKRENHEEYDWEPDSVMGKERMKSAKRLRELVMEYFPELAQQAITEFREEKKNHKYAAAAAAVADYAMAGYYSRRNLMNQRKSRRSPKGNNALRR